MNYLYPKYLDFLPKNKGEIQFDPQKYGGG